MTSNNTPSLESENLNPLRDPRLSFMQAIPSPKLNPIINPSPSMGNNTPVPESATSVSMHDPALESINTTLIQTTDPLPIILGGHVDQPGFDSSITSAPVQRPSSSSSLPPPSDPSLNLNSLVSQSVVDLPITQSDQSKNPPPNSSLEPVPMNIGESLPIDPSSELVINSVEVPTVDVTMAEVSVTTQEQPPSALLVTSDNQSNTQKTLSPPNTTQVPFPEITSTIEEQSASLVKPVDNVPSSDNVLKVESNLTDEQEIAPSREMSLSLESTGNPEGLNDLENGLPTPPIIQIDQSSTDQPNHESKTLETSSVTPVSSELPSSNTDLPTSPMTTMKFPLPAKPLPENHTPLFAPSPPPAHQNSHDGSITPPQPLLSRLATLKQRVEKDRMDGEAWLELIADAEKRGDLEKTRDVYKSFLNNFPDAATQWIAYAELELGHGHFQEVEQIFSHCLRSSVSVELWSLYINYIRRVNPIEGDKATSARDIIVASYKFSVDHVGNDRESGTIWQDYINFLKAGETTGTWQEQQKMDRLRTVYQKAVCIPINNLEQIWKDYDAFEHQMSKMTAKKFLADKSAQYMAARAALREMKTLTDPLLKPKVPVKPNWKRVEDHRSLEQWKTYLQWEEKNPLEIQDKSALNARIQYAHRQATMHMRFYCEIWYLSAHHSLKMDKTDEALLTLHAGLTANATSMVLTYAIVEIQETLKNYSVCTDAFKALIDHYHSEIDEINKTIDKEIAHGIPIIESRIFNGIEQHEAGHELTEEEQQRVKQEEELRSNITSLYKPKIDELREAAASVWITEMRFARRTEGIKPARAVFTRARKSPHLTRHVFEASAMMEYHWNKEASVATKVFDLGLKSFSEDVDYVLNYLDFLISLNDDSNARALFEKTISKISLEAARPLWHRWAAYEYIYGDSTASHKLDARISENFPDWSIVQRLGDKHNYSGLEDVLGRELGTAVEPIPLRRSPSPMPQHLSGFGFKRASSKEPIHNHNIPSGPAALQRAKQRDRSFSPDFRKRTRGQRDSISPERRMGGGGGGSGSGPGDRGGGPPPRRPRDSHEGGTKRNRFSSPPKGRETPPHIPPERENPFAWFPEGLRYFLSILPSATSFDGPCLDVHTVLQVLSEANLPTGGGTNGHGGGGGGSIRSNNNPHHNNNNHHNNGNNIHGRDGGFQSNNNVPLGWGPNRGGGAIGGLQHSRSNSAGNRRGRRK